MKDFADFRKYDMVSLKNAEESEERSEGVNAVYFDSKYANIRNIHSKAKSHK